MAQLMVRDHAVWLKHIENDPWLVEAIRSLPSDAPIKLRIEGHPVVFRKMRDGVDGRPTYGIKPDPHFIGFWNNVFETKRGQMIQIEADQSDSPVDPYLLSLESQLAEWNSPQDCEAYDGL